MSVTIDGRDRYVALPVEVLDGFIIVFDRKSNGNNPVIETFSRNERGKAERLAEKLNEEEQNHA